MKNNNGELKVCVPDDIDKIKRTIKALKSIIKTDNDFDKKMNLIDEVMTFAEATVLWGLADSTLRKMVHDNRLVEGKDYRKSGKVWIITKAAMKKLYGDPKCVN